MRRLGISLPVLAAFAALAAGFAAAEVQAQEPARKPVFDPGADAKADLAAARERAKKDNKRVLVLWGADDSPASRLLNDLLEKHKEVARKIQYEYELVRVDTGRLDRNLDLAREHGADLRAHGVPMVSLLDAEGKLLASHTSASLEVEKDGRRAYDHAWLAEILARHQAQYLKAEDLYRAALERAKREKKRVFLHFGAPWCGWCRQLETWMAKAPVRELLAKDFVDLKIDQDRTVGGEELKTRFPGSARGGIPWFAFLDENGKVLVESAPAGKNIGFPVEDAEVAHFVAMLEAVRARLSAEDVAALRASLVEHGARFKQPR